ncbi:unnamed protein product [Rotaria magnacalcarata]|uniref:Uncharacterized protein n=2 Tax=Rotaria magnacalcarata TaxID=392030 RepID=A0A819X1V9_9BILA|nr:unnamed protein product [Rotaria magnacalcarata]
MNDERNLDELQYTSLHLLTPSTTFDQTYVLKLEIERLTKELELIKVQQSQQQLHAFRTSQSDPSCSFAQQPSMKATTHMPYSNLTTRPIHVIVNTDPLQQMKDIQQFDQRKQQLNEPVIKYYYDIADLCKKYDPHMSDKQKIRKLANGLKLSLYQEVIKESVWVWVATLFNIEQQQQLSKLRYDKGRANPSYALNDMVWFKVLVRRSKLDPRYHGPFRIIK